MTDSSAEANLHDPKTFYVCLIICHLYEQQLQAKSENSVYTPQEITEFMAERTIQPSLLDQLNDAVDEDYESIDEVFDVSDESNRVCPECGGDVNPAWVLGWWFCPECELQINDSGEEMMKI